MRDELKKFDARGDTPPCPSAGFETEIIQEVGRLFSMLTPGSARLRISRVPDHPDWTEPYFQVIPTNPKAARLEGIAVKGDLTLIIGEAEREFVGFARGGTIIRGANWKQELHWIWQAVIAGGFTQLHYLDSCGNIIGWTTKFLVNGRELVFRNGRRAERLFGHERLATMIYEPYT